MSKFRKKPVIVDAVQLLHGKSAPSDGSKRDEIATFFGLDKVMVEPDGSILIHTLEGVMKAMPGDWIIRGVNGEYYPCKPDVFAKTYRPVKS